MSLLKALADVVAKKREGNGRLSKEGAEAMRAQGMDPTSEVDVANFKKQQLFVNPENDPAPRQGVSPWMQGIEAEQKNVRSLKYEEPTEGNPPVK